MNAPPSNENLFPPIPPVVVPRVAVKDFLHAAQGKLGIEVLGGKQGLNRVIEEPMIHRPGLPLAGFYKYFPFRRLQLIGLSEHEYLQTIDAAEREDILARFYEFELPGVIFTWGLPVFPEIFRLAEERGIPILTTAVETPHFTNAATILLEDLAAPTAKIHGTLLHVAGLGVLIEGKSGLGKSETALALIKRGHSLVADDLTCLRRDTDGKLIGRASPVTREYMEIRGVGVIHAPSIFGVASVTDATEINFVVSLVSQSDGGDNLVDRAGDNETFRTFLGVPVRQIIVSVAPGRDLANLVEIAAMEYKLRAAGRVAHRELDARIKNVHTLPPSQGTPPQ